VSCGTARAPAFPSTAASTRSPAASRIYPPTAQLAAAKLLGGLLTTGLSWRWIFFVNAPIGIAAVVISVFKVAESRSPHASRPDWAGFALFTVALAGLVRYIRGHTAASA
jgi:hypothetical protein